MKNLQGDIIGITDASGNIVAKYTYDSWGKLISIKDASDVDKTTDTTFIGYINPLRYKGYYYDSETGLYYLNARYYDPEVGRFISADETLDGGYNLFEYCHNNPVILYDPNGCAPKGPGHLHRGFSSLDKAAKDWAFFYHVNFAMRDGKEYGSNLYMLNGRYYYEPAVIGTEGAVDIPKRGDSVGWIHSHHNSAKPKANIFAVAGDTEVAEERRVPAYVVTPAGDIQRYDPLGNYGMDSGRAADLGTLTWIYHSRRLRGSNGVKRPEDKNDLDRYLDTLRARHGSISGAAEYYRVWDLYYEE